MPADTVGQGGLGSLHAYLLTSAILSSLQRCGILPFDLSELGHRWHSVCVETPVSLCLSELRAVCGYVRLSVCVSLNFVTRRIIHPIPALQVMICVCF